MCVTELKPKVQGFYDYDAKYTDGLTEHVCPAEVPAMSPREMMDMALAAHRLLGCKGASRSDFRWDDAQGEAGVYLLEVNTQPGMTPLSLVPEQAKQRASATASWSSGSSPRPLAGAKARRRERTGERSACPAGGVGPGTIPQGGSRVSVPKKLATKLPVKQAQANRLAGWAFGLFVVAIAGVALVALDVPAKVGLGRRRGGRRRRLPGQERRRPGHQADGPAAGV